MATWHFDIKSCLTLTVFNISANIINVNTFLCYSKCSKYFPPAFMYSLKLFLKLWTALFCRKFSHVFRVRLINSETVLGFGWSFHKSFVHHSPDMITAVSSNLESLVATVSSESFADSWLAGIVERNVLCTEPHASRRIYRCVRPQFVAVYSKLWKHKLLNSFNYCFLNVNTKITLQWHHCRVRLVGCCFLLK